MLLRAQCRFLSVGVRRRRHQAVGLTKPRRRGGGVGLQQPLGRDVSCCNEGTKNFAEAQHSLGPTEGFQIRWGKACRVGIVSPSEIFKKYVGRNPHCAHMFRQACSRERRAVSTFRANAQ